MNVKTLAAALAVLALVPLAAPAQMLVETIPERRARCEQNAAILPALEAKAADYAARAPQAVAAIKALNGKHDPEMNDAKFVGEGARLSRLVEPLADGCAVAAPEVGERAAAVVEQIAQTRMLVLRAMTGMDEASP